MARACGACFFYQGDHTDGTCFNRPPHAYVVNDENGMSVIALRPPVRNDDYCAFFSHVNNGGKRINGSTHG